MGVYIKGIEMPTNCSDCPMCYDMMECTVAEPIINFFKEELKSFDFCTERHPRCPLVNVPHVVRGKWEQVDDYRYPWGCTNCRKTFSGRYNYCPNCGADMRKEE